MKANSMALRMATAALCVCAVFSMAPTVGECCVPDGYKTCAGCVTANCKCTLSACDNGAVAKACVNVAKMRKANTGEDGWTMMYGTPEACYILHSCSYPGSGCPVGTPCNWAFPGTPVGSQNPELPDTSCIGA
jgi:hypothetical protein